MKRAQHSNQRMVLRDALSQRSIVCLEILSHFFITDLRYRAGLSNAESGMSISVSNISYELEGGENPWRGTIR